ncbi:MAG: outer membrane lipoprotein-sorting protein [Candidatus Rokubacteria bacterium]|nr:outer membrane lipoprotein-sorting protein [Candidatus Rokubacteria bacterium]
MTTVRWSRRARRAVAASAVLLAPWVASGQPPNPGDVIRRVQRQDTASDEQVQFLMQLIDASGQVRERTGTIYQRQVAPGSLDAMRLIRFHSPPDFQGSGVLTIEHSDRDNDQWLYLPAYHTTRRIAPANRGDRYLGTDFLYEDIMREKIEEYRYRTSRDDALGGVRCLVLEAVPVAERLVRETAYGKKLIWVDAGRDVILRVDYYDRSGGLLKRLTVMGIEEVSEKYRWRGAHVEDFGRRHVTVVHYHGRKIGAGVPERTFTEQYLKRGH